LKREANLARGKSAFWYLLGGGVGGGALLAGAGILCGGYSYVTGNEVIARQVAEGVKAVLDKEVITTKGTVTLADGGRVKLEAPAVVSLDPNSALVRVVGEAPADMPRPSPEQVRQDERPASQAVRTEFTDFKFVPFGAGVVQSGAVYQSRAAQSPFKQYCLYAETPEEGAHRVFTIGRNGRFDAPQNAPDGIDFRAAYKLCDWKPDGAKAAPSPSPATILTRAAKR
jgi:hypothetical protein